MAVDPRKIYGLLADRTVPWQQFPLAILEDLGTIPAEPWAIDREGESRVRFLVTEPF